MFDSGWGLLILLTAGFAAYCVWELATADRKRRARIEKQFGRAPQKNYRRAAIDRYWRALRERLPQQDIVDDVTWNDLDLEAVFDRIDTCQTSLGQDYLYAVLHQPLCGDKVLAQREALFAALENAPLRLAVQMELARLGKRIGVDLPALLFEPERFALKSPWRFALFAVLPWAGLLLLPFVPQAAALWLVAGLGHNIWLYYRTQKQLESRLETMSYLLSMLSCGHRLCKKVRTQLPAYTAQLQQALAPAAKLAGGAAMLRPSSQSDAEVFVQMLGMLTLVPLLQYCKAVRALRASGAALHALVQLLGELDTAAAVVSYRHSVEQYCLPVLEEPFGITAQAVTHPLLQQAVPNDAAISACWLLTGSNASGKSTFIRAVALNCILAQTLHTCTARKFRLAPGLVASAMAVEDNVLAGESYFVAEVKSMRRVVALAEQNVRCYCFLDELLKGTNTVERIAASCTVLRRLCGGACLCVAATHDTELTKLLAGSYENYHFCEQIEADGVHFDYRLRTGPSVTRNAIKLLAAYGFPQAVVTQAETLAQQMSGGATTLQ